jgi:hypothetical protein
VKKPLAGLLMVALGFLVAGCGAATRTSTSPSPSPSLRPSRTAPTKNELLTQFVDNVRPILVRYHKLANQLDHAIWSEAHNTADASWPTAGNQVKKLMNECESIIADLHRVETPTFMRAAMRQLLKSLHAERSMYGLIGDWLVNEEGWDGGTANGQTFETLEAKANGAREAWRMKVKVKAAELRVFLNPGTWL